MAWSREGSSEELSKYQEFQMRQRNDAHHHGQDLTGAALPVTTIDTTRIDPASKREDMKSYSEPISPTGSMSASSPRPGSPTDTKGLHQQGSRHRKRSNRQSGSLEQSSSSKSSISSTTRSPRVGRSKTAAKDTEEERHHDPNLQTSTASASGSRSRGQSPNGLNCQRQHTSISSGKKKRCTCSSCQQERAVASPSQRPYRYDPMPIYAGPLGLGDDIPSPTPSPPTSGRLSIHMAMSGHSPIGSPSSSPLLTMTHSALSISTGTRGRSGRRNHEGITGMTSPHASDGRLNDGLDSQSSATSTTSHPVIMGFHSQSHDPKSRSSKKSPSRSTTQPFLEPRSLSPSPSSPSSPPYSTSTFSFDSEMDTSPSLSPFLLSKRSFSPPKLMSPLDLVPPSSPPMRADALHAYHILQLSTKTFRDSDSSGSVKRSPVSGPFVVSNADFPHLAPPVVLVQSPSTEQLEDPASAPSRKLDQQQGGERGPLLYSSVLASSTSATPSSSSSSTPASINFSQPPRSPSQQPFSSASRGIAATPPLSPSRKKEGNHNLPSIDKKEFEAWSLNDHVQDRGTRTTPKLHYKTALLSGTSKDKVQSAQQPKTTSRQQPSNILSNHQPPQQGVNNVRRSQSKEPSLEDPGTNKTQAQARGQSSAKEQTESTAKKPASDVSSSQGPRTGNGPSGPSNVSGITPTATRSGSGVGASGGTPQHTLRRSRSAPLLATSRLSYADILKGSIKATSAPSLNNAGDVSISSPIEPSGSAPSGTPTPSPFIASSSSTSGANSSAGLSEDEGRLSGKITMPLTPTRIMRSLKRSSLTSSRSDNNLRAKIDKSNMSTPLKALYSSLTSSTDNAPQTAASMGSPDDNSSDAVDGPSDNLQPSSGTGKDNSISDGAEGTTDKEPHDVTSQGNVESTNHVDQSDAGVTSGLLFFEPAEELEARSPPHELAIATGYLMSPDQNALPKKVRPFSDPGLSASKPAFEGSIGAVSESLALNVKDSTSGCDSTTSTGVGMDKHHTEGGTTVVLELTGVEESSVQEQTDKDSGYSVDIPLDQEEQKQVERAEDQEQPGHPCLTEGEATETKCLPTTAPSGYVIPPFYFPMGKPMAAPKRRERIVVALVG
ncbi:hypothetical protein B0O80DRAFT_206895 [Mortierella sp. GBAus27b]|nr:hypothetical protein B0O80DRAFT_206895 [Mortierella sp. GBAus27b]